MRFIFITGWGQTEHSAEILCQGLSRFGPVSVVEGNACLQSRAALYALLNEESAIVCGWSMGGMLAIETVLARPACAQALVLLASTPRFVADENNPHGVSSRVLQQMSEALEKNREPMIAEFLRNCFAPEKLSRDAERILIKESQRWSNDELSEGLQYLAEVDFRDRLREIACPVFVLHGEDDRIVSSHATELFSHSISQSIIRLFPGTGHAFPMTHAGEVVETIGECVVHA